MCKCYICNRDFCLSTYKESFYELPAEEYCSTTGSVPCVDCYEVMLKADFKDD